MAEQGRRLARGEDTRAALSQAAVELLEEVVEAAIELVMAVGIDGLSIRAVADRLDTTVAALQVDWHNTQHVALEVLNRLIGEIPDPSGPWDKRLATYLAHVGTMLLDVPGLALLWCRAGHAAGEHSVAYADVIVSCLIDAGFPPAQADERGAWLHSAMLGWVLCNVEHDTAHQETQLMRERWDRSMGMIGQFPALGRIGHGKKGIAQRSPQERLDALVAMLDTWVAGLTLHLQ